MSESASRQAQAAATASRSRAQPRHEAAPAAGGDVAAVQALGTTSGNRAVSGLATGGVPLPAEVLQDMEARFGESFAQVRIHDSPQAHASAAALHAKAYTRGQDIVFSLHRYAPQTSLGKRLLAHELAHVVQQRRGGAAPVLDAHASHEQAADAAANAVAAGQAQVSVAGATGVGVARDEDDSWSSRLRRKYREIKDKIPPEYREKMQKAADYAADKAVSTAALPFGPAAAYASDGLGSSLLHGAQKAVSGEEGAADDLKKFGRDKAQEALGAAKGVATQATEVVDTAMWVGNEYKELRDKAAGKIGGPPGSAGHTLVKETVDATARVIPGMAALPDLGKASDEAKKHGLVDPETGQASITAPMSGKLNEWARSAETKLGAAPRGDEMFTPMEKAEIASSLATQAALAATGVEEVKVAMNALGALGSVRAIVEMIRHDLGWRTSPRFIGHLVGLGLSLVGLKHSMAASKFTTFVLRYGSFAAAFPILAQLAADYYTLNTSPDMPPQERKKLEASIKQDWIAVVHIVKDAILHIAQSQAGKPKAAGGPEEGPPAAGAAKGAAVADEGGAKPPAPTTPAQASPTPTPAPAPAPAVVPAVAAPAPPMAAKPPEATPITSAKGKSASPATRSLQANLARQAPGKAGSVTRLPPRKRAGTPPSEPASQPQPAVTEVPQPMAVGQTHGPGTAGGKPALRIVPGAEPPASASTSPPGAKAPPTVVSGTPAAGKGTGPAKGAGGKAKAKAPAKPAPQAAAEPETLPPVNAKGGRGSNDEPLVAVRVAGGGGKTKGTYYEEGTPRFNRAATDPRFVVVPKSTAEGVFGARPAGTPGRTDIRPLMRNGVQMESGGAGGGKANQHKIMARAETRGDPDLNAATFGKTIGAARSEAQGYAALIESGEYGIQRPGNASTGGVDAITARVTPANAGQPGQATVYLNDFTTPGTAKPPKASHAKWAGELGQVLQDKRFGFGNVETDRLVLEAIRDNRVVVRPVEVAGGAEGPRVDTTPRTHPVEVPPAVRQAAAEALAKLPAAQTGPGAKVRVATESEPKVRVGTGVRVDEGSSQAQAEVDLGFEPPPKKKAMKLP